ncbi:class I SAM-dependent methyltransferase [Halolamina sp.]|jgi:SAM-dependent methyltransferase|uniref:class I SAM-dependent methyltransferase n=1 Tax=Halolamina sp. TaxID=1940283 RepID=UPI000223B8DE|nr:Methyltransferase type 11 [halophilic archaeon DL31]
MDPHDVREDWAEREGEFSPTYYAHKGPNEASESIRELLNHYLGTDARVLEIGCSSGRHLAHLHDGGFRNLHGIEINADAIEMLREEYPNLAADATFHVGDAGALLREFEDGAFDAVYTVETLQHIHPDEADAVFDEVAQVTDDLLITVENESARGAGAEDDVEVSYVNDEFPLYHRDWKSIFTDRGFAQLLQESSKRRDMLRAFRRP